MPCAEARELLLSWAAASSQGAETASSAIAKPLELSMHALELLAMALDKIIQWPSGGCKCAEWSSSAWLSRCSSTSGR